MVELSQNAGGAATLSGRHPLKCIKLNHGLITINIIVNKIWPDNCLSKSCISILQPHAILHKQPKRLIDLYSAVTVDP